MATFLILAHRDFEHLKELVSALTGHRIIIHLDRKSKIPRFQVNDLADNKNVYLINRDNSINVQWAGYSQVQAMLILIETALPLMKSTERMMFLSGSDYPIQSLKDISLCLDNDLTIQYLRYYPLDDRQKDLWRWSFYHRWDYRIFKRRGSLFYRANSLFLRFLTILETLLRGPKAKPDYPLMAGSQWFSVSKECMEDMLSQRDTIFDKFFSTMFAPDEVYFHTLFAKSNFSQLNVDNGKLDSDSRQSRIFQVRNLTYVDESLDKWLTLEDLDTLKKSNFLFARKFDSNISLGLRSSLRKSFKFN